MSFGNQLRGEREERGVGLEDVAAATHVSGRHLAALEADDYGAMPGGVFNRGIVRSYCRHLGLNEADWLARFSAEPGGRADELNWAVFSMQVQRSRRRKGVTPQPIWAVVLMMLTLASLTWGAWRLIQGNETNRRSGSATAMRIDSATSSQE